MLRGMAEKKATLLNVVDEREKTISMLSDAYANDLFDVDEFENRVELANKAESSQALVALRSDLISTQSSHGEPTTALTTTSETELEAITEAQPKSAWAVAVMGGSTRKGQWRVPKKMRALSVMGGVSLDFREAIFAPGVSTLHVSACMGGVEIILPPDIAVEAQGIGIMGAFESVERSPRIPDPDLPLLRIKGLAIMGGVEVLVRHIGETRRDARKRRKREGKALPPGARARLPKARVVSSDNKK